MPRLLVVDDDQPLARSLVRVFKAHYEVTAVNTANDAIHLINAVEPPFDCLLTDYDLSSPLNGLDVIRAAEIRGIPAVLYSSTEGLTYEPRLHKPVLDPQELLDAVAHAINKEDSDAQRQVPGLQA
jgi:CheY-like chemotaxis protein